MKKYLPPLLILLAIVVPGAPASAQRVDPVYVEDRLNQLQQSITLLTGQIEQLQYRNQQLQQQLEKMQADYEFRIEQLEKGGGGAVRPGGAPPPRPAGPPQANQPPPPAGGVAAAPQGQGADEAYHAAFKLLQDGDYAGAERGFKSFVQRNPQHVLAGNAQYWLGETFYARRDYQSALTAFAEGYKTYKASPKGPDNLLKLGITLSAVGRKGDACTMFTRFTQDYPRATDLQKRRIAQERQRNQCGG